MTKEDYAKKVADRLWRICYVNKIADSLNILEHLGFLLYFRSLERRYHKDIRIWEYMVDVIKNQDYREVVSFYKERLLEAHKLINVNQELFRDLQILPFPFGDNTFIELIKYLDAEFEDSKSDMENNLYGQVFEHLIMKIASQGSIYARDESWRYFYENARNSEWCVCWTR
ncbi:hypothetical protein [Bacillus sp. ISL-7]|uniref:hypothetical protein n=1 Tax=Bacillus sp. ISL-7 TaxID=2819136 RepID=UPI001BE62D73|nr:hypothetical protein [Bacillus sp. ISL-7]MBT2734602.1 hypothetical protein [Bacillus sp. ISL-7]